MYRQEFIYRGAGPEVVRTGNPADRRAEGSGALVLRSSRHSDCGLCQYTEVAAGRTQVVG